MRGCSSRGQVMKGHENGDHESMFCFGFRFFEPHGGGTHVKPKHATCAGHRSAMFWAENMPVNKGGDVYATVEC